MIRDYVGMQIIFPMTVAAIYLNSMTSMAEKQGIQMKAAQAYPSVKGYSGIPTAGAFGLTRKERLVKFITHLICISMLFILPEVISSFGRPFKISPEFQFGIYLKSLIFMSVFYVNYYFIIGRSFERKRFAWRLVGYNLIVVVVSLLFILVICKWQEPYMPHPGHRGEGVGENPDHLKSLLWSAKFLSRDLVMLVLTIGLSVALKLSDTWVKLADRSREIEVAQRQEELNSLKKQLNPHFLFNTLNSIYALIAVSPSTAQDAVHELSRMLRYVLYENSDEVELQREFDFIMNYIKLMKLRIGDGGTSLSVNINSNDCKELPIAPLLFIPLIENVFKYGNTGRSEDTIEIELTANDGCVRCFTSNVVASGKISGKGGIGLHNLRRRLALIYGDKASLSITETPERFSALLTLDLRRPVG